MIHYEPIKINIDTPGLAEVIIKAVVWHYGLPNFIISDCGLVFTLKFWSLLYYFFEIKQKFSMAFYL